MSVSKAFVRVLQFNMRKSRLLNSPRRCGISLQYSFKSAGEVFNGSISSRNKTTTLCASITKRKVKAMDKALSPLDPSSFSRPEQAVVRHISLDLNVDFEQKILNGSAVLSIDVIENVKEVILDVSNLKIESVETEDGTPLAFVVDNEVPNFGSKLSIALPVEPQSGENPPNPNSPLCTKLTLSDIGYTVKVRSVKVQTDACGTAATCVSCVSCVCESGSEDSVTKPVKKRLKIKIKYSTSPNASALQWLEPSQTSGKKHPYLFSQCQPIHARSIVPCQDTPAVKFTYDAVITAPEEFTVLMSALRGEVKGGKTYFNQPMPLPAYLLAIAVGVLESKSLGPRSKVWSEKKEIDKSAWEFAETEKYLQAAENLCGPYEWSQYDLLVMPPSFPYGGMENPCLTFVTPTLLAGDRSLANVIVHEIMHSWTGNLVTNRNFEHFWLNEGFTVFLERKVGASLIADPVQSKKDRDFQSLLGLQELQETINGDLGADNPLTSLVPDLDGIHPDDSFSRVPYEKGSLFLRYLEDLLGGPEVFDDFLRAYLSKFKKKSLDTDQFKSFFLEYFKGDERLKWVDWNSWLHNVGMPPIIPDYDNSKTKAVTSLVQKLTSPDPQVSAADVQSFCPHQTVYLLQELINHTPLPLELLQKIGSAYKVDTSDNAEIKFRWLRLSIRSKDQSKLDDTFSFVNTVGRMKFVRPLYRDLYAWEEVREQAIKNFKENEQNMMHVTAYTLRKDLHIET